MSGADSRPAFGLFRRKRSGVPLTRAEVKEIKAGRKRVKKELKKAGIYSRREFKVLTSSMGLYFDKPKLWFLLWLFHGKGLWVLLGLAALALGTIFAMSKVSQMRGYFTINLQDEMFKKGFVLSDTEDFAQPVSYLFCEPATDVPCISITSIGADVNEHEGQHNGYGYFAYTFYIRNEGEETVDYTWELRIDGESKNISVATWVMVIEDGVMRLYAEMTEDGLVQTVPARDDDTRGYLEIPVMALADPNIPFTETVKTVGAAVYKRVVTLPFVDENIVAHGGQTDVKPTDVHKYTVVIWLEGDDPQCTNDLIEGHLGLNFQFQLVEE